MCAPHEMTMEQPAVSRFNSQSTSRTLVGSDNGLVSPIFSPFEASGQLPIVQTADSKQWIDLDYLSPKILRELRRQYDPSIKDEANGPLAKGAAKVKAWVRQSKLGIEIRLRRKLNSDQDEVTDIHLVPNTLGSQQEWRDEKQPLIAELPAPSSILAELPGEITEMPDTSTKPELSGTEVPSRSSTDSTLGEPLPRYEPRRGYDATDITPEGRTRSPERAMQASHGHSPSQDSIIATPTRGISLWDPPLSDADGESAPQESAIELAQDEKKSLETKDGEPDDLKTGLAEAEQQLTEEQKLSQGLRDLIKAIQEQQRGAPSTTESNGQEERISRTKSTEGLFRNLKLANKTTYETETDVEPPSPVRRKQTRPLRTKNVTMPKRKTSLVTPKIAKKKFDDVDEDLEHDDDPLLRQPTLPKRVPASAGAEAMWKSLLRMQEKLLGPEHPLCFQAKSDLARSRANGHAIQDEDLITLRKSGELAKSTLGKIHPWVAAFLEDLAKLERRCGSLSKARGGRTSESEQVPARAAPDEGVEATSSSLSPAIEQHENTQRGLAALSAETAGTSPKEPHAAVPRIVTNLDNSEEQSSFPASLSAQEPLPADILWSSPRPPHEPRSTMAVLPSMMLGAFTNAALKGISWLQRNYGPEQPVAPGKVRVRWTCSCGTQLHDDFIERRQGAARELERYLNRPRTLTGGNGTPTSPSSSSGSRSFTNSSMGGPPSSQTSWSSYNFPGPGSSGSYGNGKSPQVISGPSMYPPYSPLPEPPWLLTCANEDRYTPKLAHLDMAPHKIRSDKDLALSLRDHYFNVNKKWWRSLRIRGLATIEFVQFEVHQNRFADIRKCPDMPPPSTGEYNFEPSDLLPPVGSAYLLHLFKHPEDYDGELITYLRAPKKNGRLQLGVGFGINLVEGFLADRVWMVVSGLFALGSLVFAVAWGTKRHDVQGASGVASWMVAFAVLIVGWLQAYLG